MIEVPDGVGIAPREQQIATDQVRRQIVGRMAVGPRLQERRGGIPCRRPVRVTDEQGDHAVARRALAREALDLERSAPILVEHELERLRVQSVRLDGVAASELDVGARLERVRGLRLAERLVVAERDVTLEREVRVAAPPRTAREAETRVDVVRIERERTPEPLFGAFDVPRAETLVALAERAIDDARAAPREKRRLLEARLRRRARALGPAAAAGRVEKIPLERPQVLAGEHVAERCAAVPAPQG